MTSVSLNSLGVSSFRWMIEKKISTFCGYPHKVEQWFSILTRKLIRRGDFTSRDDLETRITEFTIGYNKTAHPWKWKYDADAEHARYLERHPRKDALAQAA